MATAAQRPAVRGEGRERLLVAAREAFAEKGFARTGVREIAARAGVTEPAVYWHFGSKRKLFEAAVAEPFAAFMDEFFASWDRRPVGERAAMVEAVEYLQALYDVLHSQRDLLQAMLADRAFNGDGTGGTQLLQQTVTELLTRHQERLEPEIRQRGYRPMNLHIWTRLFFATILGLAVHGDLLESGAPIDARAYITELAEMSIYGAGPRPT